MRTFGQLVREIREKKGTLLQELADDVGKSVAYLSQIERPQSQTVPSEDVGRAIIEKLQLDAATRKKLEKALERTIREHRVERVYDSSRLLEEFFQDVNMSVEQVAKKMTGKKGIPRSRQIVQVWKNGVQLPTPEAANDLISVFAEAGIRSERLGEYRRKHLYDTIYFSKDIAHFSDQQKAALAECAIEIMEGRYHPEGAADHRELSTGAARRRFKGEMLS